MTILTVTPPHGSPWKITLTKAPKLKLFNPFLAEEYTPFFAACNTVRTNSLKNFASDFFFPTLVWQISRVKKSAYPTLSKLAVLFFDILTMPIRIIFLPTRILSNTFRKETELHKWLRKKNAPKEILNAEVVLVNLDLGGIGEGTTEPFYFIDAPTVNPEIFDKKA